MDDIIHHQAKKARRDDPKKGLFTASKTICTGTPDLKPISMRAASLSCGWTAEKGADTLVSARGASADTFEQQQQQPRTGALREPLYCKAVQI